MAHSPALSLRTIAARVGRSHTLVRRLLSTHGLSDCSPDIQLAAAHLALRHRIPAEAVAQWAKSTDSMPTAGWLVYTADEIQVISDEKTFALLMGNPSLTALTTVRVDALTYQAPRELAGVAA